MISINQKLPTRVAVVKVTYKGSETTHYAGQKLLFDPKSGKFTSVSGKNKTHKVARWGY